MHENIPADSGTRCSSDNSGLHAPEETLCAISSRNDTGSVKQALGISDLGIGRASSSLQQSLNNIEGSCGSGGDTTGETSSSTVSQGVVARAAVHEFCD